MIQLPRGTDAIRRWLDQLQDDAPPERSPAERREAEARWEVREAERAAKKASLDARYAVYRKRCNARPRIDRPVFR